jgi:hypothetical protein
VAEVGASLVRVPPVPITTPPPVPITTPPRWGTWAPRRWLLITVAAAMLGCAAPGGALVLTNGTYAHCTRLTRLGPPAPYPAVIRCQQPDAFRDFPTADIATVVRARR